MADKNYKLSFVMTDGTTKTVQFTVPQGDKGETGATGATGDTGPAGVGITNITISEV